MKHESTMTILDVGQVKIGIQKPRLRKKYKVVIITEFEDYDKARKVMYDIQCAVAISNAMYHSGLNIDGIDEPRGLVKEETIEEKLDRTKMMQRADYNRNQILKHELQLKYGASNLDLLKEAIAITINEYSYNDEVNMKSLQLSLYERVEEVLVESNNLTIKDMEGVKNEEI